MTKTKTQKEVTLSEFKAWLEGIEELQPKSWVPDATQWKLIRNKIKMIIPDATQVTTTSQGVVQQHPPVPQQAPRLPNGIPTFPEVPSSIPPGRIEPPTNPLLTPQGGKIVTPNIDTADGSYNSSFG